MTAAWVICDELSMQLNCFAVGGEIGIVSAPKYNSVDKGRHVQHQRLSTRTVLSPLHNRVLHLIHGNVTASSSRKLPQLLTMQTVLWLTQHTMSAQAPGPQHVSTNAEAVMPSIEYRSPESIRTPSPEQLDRYPPTGRPDI